MTASTVSGNPASSAARLEPNARLAAIFTAPRKATAAPVLAPKW